MTSLTLGDGTVVNVLLHGEVQLMDWGESRTAGPWIKLRLSSPELLDAFRSLDPGEMKREQHVLSCTITDHDIATILADGEKAPATAEEPRWGVQAKELRLSGFFLRPEVWRAVGSDSSFLLWLRRQRCCKCKSESGVQAAHVRTIEDGAGTGIKPMYSAVPLCDECHNEQHQHGPSVLGDPEWWARQRVEHVRAWGWEALRQSLGYESWASVPPDELGTWAAAHSLPQRWLPSPYRTSTEDSGD